MPFSGSFLIGAAIGSGNTALAAERGGADFLLAINAGRLRNMGGPSIACMLPIFDAAALTDGFARAELLTQCRIPVLVGVNVWGRDFDPAAVAESVRDAGFAGAVNFPSCMHYSRPMQQILARAGRGIDREVALLRRVQDTGLTSMFYCATRTQARLAADVGIEHVCLNLGWNVGGARGHRSRASLEEVATMAREIGRLIKRINPRTRFFLEGGPIATAEDLARVLSLAEIDGYVGGSTFERMPLEVSVADQIGRFRQAGKRGAALDEEGARLVAWSRAFGFLGRSKAQLAFLQRLRALRAGTGTVLVLAERGIDTLPVLKALSGRDGDERFETLVQLDAAEEEIPARVRSLLFGHIDTIERQRPALADGAIDLLAIHAPERLPAGTQRRLARALRDGMFRAPCSRRSLTVAPRVVLVSSMPAAGTGAGQDMQGLGLDPELLAQVAGWTLRVPPLRERTEDLMTIVMALSARDLGKAMDRASFSDETLKRLHAHLWPGNEAELGAVLGTLAGRSGAGPVQPEELLPLLVHHGGESRNPRGEKERIVDALWRHGFNRTRAAAALGLSRKTLYNKIRKFGLAG